MAKKLGKKAAAKHESNGDDDAEIPKTGRQKALEGDGFPGPTPEEVCDARDQYLSAMRSHAKTAKKKAESEQALIEAMHKHDIVRVNLDGENKYFKIESTEKIKTNTIPKEQRDERAAREHATAG